METNEAANMAAPAAEDQETDELVHIEDVSRKTTIREILKIAADRLHYLGFPKRDLKMGFLQQTHDKHQKNLKNVGWQQCKAEARVCVRSSAVR